MSPEEARTRHEIGALMRAGLETQTTPFPRTHVEFGVLLAQVRELPPGDLKAKLVLVGFVDQPHGPDGMRCQECIYYLVHRRVCDLPELALPVHPDCCCRLWHG
jgi:hypothetical protein